MAEYRLTEEDLTPMMKRAFDQAYEERERKQASREDYAQGFIAGLLALNSKSSFRQGALDK